MVKELQKKFIKTTMLVVTILLVVFLVVINTLNFSLSKSDSESSLDKIVGMNLRSVPGGMTGDNMGPGDEGRNGPEGASGSMEPMSEADAERDGPEGLGEDLGRYSIARVNTKGVIVFHDLTHDPGMELSDLVELINKANVSFGVKATGEVETETETEYRESGAGETPPEIPEGSQPANVGETPPEKPEGDQAAGAGETPPEKPEGDMTEAGGAGMVDTPPSEMKTENGRIEGYRYYAMQQADGSVAYAFLNIHEQRESIARMIIVTVVVGAALWILIFFVVTFLSKKAIAPIAENIEKQRQFITDAGHEIKTPLAVIVSNVDVQELHSGKTKWLDNIRAQALRLSELTKQMLTLSKMEESGAASFVATTFDASQELEDLVRIFRESASLRDIDIRTQIEPGVQIHFSKEQYQQMIELLLDNAMKYGKDHGFLAVSLHGERKTVTLSFKNDCEKLPDVDPDRLFERFFRSDSSRSRQTGGSGIGLAVVRAIAEHGGGYARAHFLPDEVIEFEIQLQKKI